LRLARHGSPTFEARILPAVAEVGLKVPRVLAQHDKLDLTLLTIIPGENLLRIAERSPVEAAVAKALLFEAIDSLHAATPALQVHPASSFLERVSLRSLLDEFLTKDGEPWRDVPLIRHASQFLQNELPNASHPLVFTNGDYQPANFLALEGRLSGMVDFELARFEDPLIGFAKYLVFKFSAFNNVNTVPEYLQRKGYTQADFATRWH
jgi:aminoglycoside phosphotransferase (APT) family kinase protein